MSSTRKTTWSSPTSEKGGGAAVAVISTPAGFSLVVLGAGLDPARGRAGIFLLPEGRVRLEVVHEELGALEGGLAMRRERHHLHDRLTGTQRAVAMDDGCLDESEASHGF